MVQDQVNLVCPEYPGFQRISVCGGGGPVREMWNVLPRHILSCPYFAESYILTLESVSCRVLSALELSVFEST